MLGFWQKRKWSRHIKVGVSALKAKRYDLAVKEFTHAANVAIDLDAEWAARAHNNLGSAYRRSGYYKQALISYKRVAAECRKSKLRSADEVFYSAIRNMARLYSAQFGLVGETPLLGPGSKPADGYWLGYLLALVGQRPESMAMLEILVVETNAQRYRTIAGQTFSLKNSISPDEACQSLVAELTSGSSPAVRQEAMDWIGNHTQVIAEHIGML